MRNRERPATSHHRRLVGPAILLGAALVLASCSGSDPRSSVAPNTAATVAPGRATAGSSSAPPARLANVTWSERRESPIANRTGFTSVWTGRELLICCGTKRAAAQNADPATTVEAAAYDPAADSWRPIATPPTTVENWGAITVADTTIYFFDGGAAPWSYVAYDIPTDTWREIPAPPQNSTRARGSRLGPSAWTGKEIITPISTPPAGDNDIVMVAFDPVSSAWRTLPTPPVRMDPTSILYDNGKITLVGEVRGASDQGGTVVSAVFDSTTNTWSEPERTPVERRDPVVIGGGDRVVAWDVSGSVRVQQNGQWRELPPIPFPEDECGWKGSQIGQRLVLWRCTQQGAVLDIDTGQWSVLPTPPTELQDTNITVVNGNLLLWAGATPRLQPYTLAIE